MNKYNKKKKRLSEISEFDFLMIKEALFFLSFFFLSQLSDRHDKSNSNNIHINI